MLILLELYFSEFLVRLKALYCFRFPLPVFLPYLQNTLNFLIGLNKFIDKNKSKRVFKKETKEDVVHTSFLLEKYFGQGIFSYKICFRDRIVRYALRSKIRLIKIYRCVAKITCFTVAKIVDNTWSASKTMANRYWYSPFFSRKRLDSMRFICQLRFLHKNFANCY